MVTGPTEVLSRAAVALEGHIVFVPVLVGARRVEQRASFSEPIPFRACRVHPALIETNRLSGIRWSLRLLLLGQERSDTRRIETNQFGKDTERIRELATPDVGLGRSLRRLGATGLAPTALRSGLQRASDIARLPAGVTQALGHLGLRGPSSLVCGPA